MEKENEWKAILANGNVEDLERYLQSQDQNDLIHSRIDFPKGDGSDQYACTLQTPLQIASRLGHTSLVGFLVSKGANIDERTDNGATSLYIACQNGHLWTAERLLALGADLNLSHGDCYTPLSVATRFGHTDIVKLLLGYGVETDYVSRTLHEACMRGKKDIVELLLAHEGVDIDIMLYNSTPLVMACEGRFKEIIDLLILRGANLQGMSKDGERSSTTPIDAACSSGDLETAELLIAHGADINAVKRYGHTALSSACDAEMKEAAETLISLGADVNARSSEGAAPLHYAIKGGQQEIAEMLIAHGADVNAVMDNGVTPLFYACEYGYDQDSYQRAVFFHWNDTKREKKDLVELLIAHGANVDCAREDGYTPLHIACEKEFYGIAALLLENSKK